MSEKFFTFPLYALGLEKEPKGWADCIMSYCCIEAGRVRREQLDHDEDRLAEEIEAAHKPSDYSTDFYDHDDLVLGGKLLSVKMGSVLGGIRQHGVVKTWVGGRAAAFGSSPLVFVGADLVWEVYRGDGIAWRDFSVLCAVNSVIGLTRTKPVLIRREMVAARALGFKRPADVGVKEKKKLLTTSQIRTTLDNLEERGFFHRIVASPRRTYFAKGVERDAAVNAVVDIMKAKSKLKAQREKDRELFRNLK